MPCQYKDLYLEMLPDLVVVIAEIPKLMEEIKRLSEEVERLKEENYQQALIDY